MIRVFIDGAEGTTGLMIERRLRSRADVELSPIEPELRKDPTARRDRIRAADVAFLCLPDEAARESAALAEGSRAILIDASTAHRVDPGWAYGFPELSAEYRARIRASGRVAVPGCHATGFASIVYPLIASGAMPRDYPVSAFSLTGYSGGGKRMIREYRAADRAPALESARLYALAQTHKHLPEMTAVSGLAHAPSFLPAVCDYYAGMAVSVPIFPRLMKGTSTVAGLIDLYSAHYAGSAFVEVSGGPEGGAVDASALAGTNRLRLYISGNDERPVIVSVFDNLGKGASGAAMQCMNIALGMDETIGLTEVLSYDGM